eukprot:1157541-Pelagomonas_calceolata.AAC.1
MQHTILPGCSMQQRQDVRGMMLDLMWHRLLPDASLCSRGRTLEVFSVAVTGGPPTAATLASAARAKAASASSPSTAASAGKGRQASIRFNCSSSASTNMSRQCVGGHEQDVRAII